MPREVLPFEREVGCDRPRTHMLDLAGRAASTSERGIVFDPKRRAASASFKSIIKACTEALERQESALGLRVRRRTAAARGAFAGSVEAILCNVAAISLMRIDCPLAVPRSSAAMWAKGRYSEPVYGQHFLDALDLMSRPEVAFLELVARGHGSIERRGSLTTYRPTSRLLAELSREKALHWADLTRPQNGEVLILKARKDKESGRGASIEYRETDRTRRMRNEVRRINAYLDRAAFWIEPKDYNLGMTKEALPIDPTRRTVRRIFNNASWFEGGRLFDGYWETMRSTDRRLLRIGTAQHPEGEPVVSVDYGQLFPRLAYVKAQTEPPKGDLYAFGQDGWTREGRKRIMNSLLLADRPLRNWPEGTASLFPKGTRFKDVVAAIREAHPRLAASFDKGQGLKLMCFESELMICVLHRLMKQDVVALPLHDAVLVGASEAGRAREAMEAALAEYAPKARAAVSAA